MLEIIGAGWGRTGTLSLKTALEQLGFGPCYHAVEVMRHPEHQDRWDAAFAGDPDWEAVFAGYRATVDFPGAAFWRELVDAYPDAKVILTVRDPHAWHASVRATFLEAAGPDGRPPVPGIGDEGASGGPDWGAITANLQDEEIAVADFRRHIADVRGYVPEDRLLVYEVAEGWGPLCRFLGAEVPDGPFPRLNDSDAFHDLIAENTPDREGRPAD